MRNSPRPGDTIVDTFANGEPMRWFTDIDQPWVRFGPKSKAHFPIRHASHDGIGALCSGSFMQLDPLYTGPVPGVGTCITCTDMIIRRTTQGEKMPTVPTKAERLAAQVARLQAELDRIALMPDEPQDPEATIFFEKTFGTSRKYTYAAVKAGDGLWYTTGPKSPGGYSWQQLIEWILDDGDQDTQIWFASEWEPLN